MNKVILCLLVLLGSNHAHAAIITGSVSGANADVDSTNKAVLVQFPTAGSPQFADRSVSGTLSAACLDANINACGAGSTVQIATNGSQTVQLQTSGSWSAGVMNFDYSLDGGVTWFKRDSTDCINSQVDAVNAGKIFTTWGASLISHPWVARNVAGATHVRIRMATAPTGSASVVLTAASGSSNITPVQNNPSANLSGVSPNDGYKATYSATAVGLVPVSGATDFFTITGSATRTVKVEQVVLSCTQTTAGTVDVVLLKRSTANTAGTSTAKTAVPFDSVLDAAATATVLAYTANPTTGTLVSNIDSRKIFVPAPATAVQTLPTVYTFGNRPGRAGVLKGTGEVIALNFNAQTLTGFNCDATVEWTEE